MRKLYTATILLWAVSSVSQSIEEPSAIETDRPDQTETPSIVPKGMFQMETGIYYEQTDHQTETFLLPTALLKYGISKRFEVRLITEYQRLQQTQTVTGLSPILVGFKANLSEEKGIMPKTSLIAHILLPDAASKEFQEKYYSPEFRFSMQHTVSEKISIGYNLGGEWDGTTGMPTYIYTFTTGFGVSEKINTFIEVFGFAPQSETANHSFDGGLTYLISNDMMIDISGGVGLTENAPDYFISAGFSFRI